MLFLILGVLETKASKDAASWIQGRAALRSMRLTRFDSTPAEADLGERVSTLSGQGLHALLEAHRMGSDGRPGGVAPPRRKAAAHRCCR